MNFFCALLIFCQTLVMHTVYHGNEQTPNASLDAITNITRFSEGLVRTFGNCSWQFCGLWFTALSPDLSWTNSPFLWVDALSPHSSSLVGCKFSFIIAVVYFIKASFSNIWLFLLLGAYNANKFAHLFQCNHVELFFVSFLIYYWSWKVIKIL